MSGEYWSVDIPGLTQDQAQVVQKSLSTTVPDGVMLIDPKHFMTRGYEKAGVELLVKALNVAVESGALSDYDQECAQTFIDDFEEWLAYRSTN